MKKIIILFLTMMKIGLFTFGGGYAMIALLDNEFVVNKKWIGKEEFLDMTAIAESTPGPIAINCATYLGYKRAGFVGALVATVGVCIPSFVIIYLISLFIDDFLKFKVVESAFHGIQICVIYLIARAGLKMFKSIKKTPFNLTVFFGVSFLMLICFFLSIKFSTVFCILISGILGVVGYFVNSMRGMKK